MVSTQTLLLWYLVCHAEVYAQLSCFVPVVQESCNKRVALSRQIVALDIFNFPPWNNLNLRLIRPFPRNELNLLPRLDRDSDPPSILSLTVFNLTPLWSVYFNFARRRKVENESTPNPARFEFRLRSFLFSVRREKSSRKLDVRSLKNCFVAIDRWFNEPRKTIREFSYLEAH